LEALDPKAFEIEELKTEWEKDRLRREETQKTPSKKKKVKLLNDSRSVHLTNNN